MEAQWLNPSQYAEKMRVSAQAIRDMCRKDKISAVKIGSLWRIPYIEPADLRAEKEMRAIAQDCVERTVDFIYREIAVLEDAKESLLRHLDEGQ